MASALASRIAHNEVDGGDTITIGNLSARRDFTDVRDVVRAYRLLMERGEPGEVYNVCTGVDVAVQELADQLLALATRPMRFETDPDLLRPVDVPVLRGDHAKLTAATGWEPEISLTQTLADLLDDWRRQVKEYAHPTAPPGTTEVRVLGTDMCARTVPRVSVRRHGRDRRSIGTDWEPFDRGQLDLPVRLLGSILDRTAEAWLVVEPVPPAPEKSGWRKKQPKSERSITVSPYAEDDAPHLLLYGTFPKGPAFADRGVALPSWATRRRQQPRRRHRRGADRPAARPGGRSGHGAARRVQRRGPGRAVARRARRHVHLQQPQLLTRLPLPPHEPPRVLGTDMCSWRTYPSREVGS